MTLRLNGSTSGYAEITAPAVAGNNTVTLPSSNGAANQLLKNGATAGSLEFASNVVIDSSGRLLVGTDAARASRFGGTSFNSPLQIESNVEAAQSITRWSADASCGRLHIQKGRGAITAAAIVLNDDFLGDLSFSGYDGANMTNGARISANVDGTPGANDMPGRLVFSTTADGASSPTERMRITNNGTVFIGKATTAIATDGHAFIEDGQLRTSITSNNNAWMNRNGTDGSIIVFRKSDVTVGNISVTTTATSYGTSSDYRLKENIAPLGDSISRLLQLKPSRFNFKTEPNAVVDGFIAHEAQEVVPECVTGTKDEVDDDGNPVYQGIDQSKLVPLLTAALQEALQQIEVLTARVAALEANQP